MLEVGEIESHWDGVGEEGECRDGCCASVVMSGLEDWWFRMLLGLFCSDFVADQPATTRREKASGGGDGDDGGREKSGRGFRC